jgi:hypothetical protein
MVLGIEMTVGGERGAQLTPRVEHRLVDGVAVGVQLYDKRVERDVVSTRATNSWRWRALRP